MRGASRRGRREQEMKDTKRERRDREETVKNSRREEQ